MLKIFSTLDYLIDKLVAPVSAIIGLLIALSFVIGIISRSALGTGIFGLEEIILLAVVWFYMLGAVLASKERSHLHADFVSVLFKSDRVVLSFKVLSTVLSIVMGLLFTYWSYSLLQWGISRQELTPVFSIPVYVSQASVFLAAILMNLYLVRDLVADIKMLALSRDKKSEAIQG